MSDVAEYNSGWNYSAAADQASSRFGDMGIHDISSDVQNH
jgi:hypothetical protein